MKNYGDLGGCYPPRPTASTDNTLLDLHNSSYDTQPHSLIVKYTNDSRKMYPCHVYEGLTQPRIQWGLISKRNIPLIFVKFDKQVPFHVYIHLISFSIVTLCHETHICLVTVKMFHL